MTYITVETEVEIDLDDYMDEIIEMLGKNEVQEEINKSVLEKIKELYLLGGAELVKEEIEKQMFDNFGLRVEL